jgi:hypothetical protein
MWAVLGIFVKKSKTKVVPELNFAWASDSIEKLKQTLYFTMQDCF